MQNFADQCLDLAESILEQNLGSINEDGSVKPFGDEDSRIDESGHAALAIGEYYRATDKEKHGDYDLVDLVARCITFQSFNNSDQENGLAFSALGMLSFGTNKEKNPAWERLLEETQDKIDSRLLHRSDYTNHLQAFNIAKAVARFTLGLSKKDETGRLIERFLARIDENSSAGYCDEDSDEFGGVFDIYGVMSFVFIRQALQLHSNVNLRERKLPSLRTYVEKYVRMIPDMTRHDGLAWAYGRSIGVYGQMHCISLILQALRDGWIKEEKRPLYILTLRKLFHYFFVSYLDQEKGDLVIRDGERSTVDQHTTRMANFDAARYLSQWARLARSIENKSLAKPPVVAQKSSVRYVAFDKKHKKEHGLFIYKNPETGLLIQLPLVGDKKPINSDSLAFPHSPGVFDWPVNRYMPIMQPELTFGDNVVVPSFYGKNCVAGMGLRKSFYFRYDQPELINTDLKMVNGLGSCKVNWSFSGNKITSDFSFTVKSQVTLDSMRYVIAIATPHSKFRIGSSPMIGQEGLRVQVIKDDFQATWLETEVVTQNLDYRTYFGNIHYLQVLSRDHSLVMRPNQVYRLSISFDPDIVEAEA